MDELKKCCGYKGHWECADKYPDHMVPIENFHVENSREDGHFTACKACCKIRDSLRNPTRERHPVTGQFKWTGKEARQLS